MGLNIEEQENNCLATFLNCYQDSLLIAYLGLLLHDRKAILDSSY